MKVLDYIQEIDDILENGQTIPLSKKVGVDPSEIREILKNIKDSLPDEISQAQYILSERQRILDKAKEDYDKVLHIAKAEADRMISEDEITAKAMQRAEDLLRKTKENCKVMKLEVLKYTDDMLVGLSDKTDEVKSIYFDDMFNALDEVFNRMYGSIAGSRESIKEQSLLVQDEK